MLGFIRRKEFNLNFRKIMRVLINIGFSKKKNSREMVKQISTMSRL